MDDDLTLKQADELGSIFVTCLGRDARGKAILFQKMKGGVIYTQVDTENGPVYMPGLHRVNRTGVYAVLLDKNVERDFTIIGRVPGITKLEDCEVIIHKASVSYPRGKGCDYTTLIYDDETNEDSVDIVVLSTRFANPDGGEELDSD